MCWRRGFDGESTIRRVAEIAAYAMIPRAPLRAESGGDEADHGNRSEFGVVGRRVGVKFQETSEEGVIWR